MIGSAIAPRAAWARSALAAWMVILGLGMALLACGRETFVETSRYSVREVAGFRVAISPALVAQPQDADADIEILRDRLIDFRARVRPEIFEALRVVPIWVERGPNSERAMAGYHGAAWVRAHGLNPDKAQSIEIADPRAFFGALVGPSPMAITHELAHAYCDRVLHDDPSIRIAYDAAVRSHAYEHVRRRTGEFARAYALQSAAEYFAELTEAYLGTNDQQPLDRDELRTFDPQGFRLMETTWGGQAK